MRSLAIVVVLLLTGCAGRVDYTPPGPLGPTTNSITVDRPMDEVWSQLIPALGTRFFVINNLDRASGLINFSYAGNPEAYVDCGRVESYVKNAKGERTYRFAGAADFTTYEIMDDQTGLSVYDRSMALEGRMNLILEDIRPQTRVTANARYIVTRTSSSRNVSDPRVFGTSINSIAFNSGQSGTFPPNKRGSALVCRPTGRFEADVLEMVKP
jgi:hypothetical protein